MAKAKKEKFIGEKLGANKTIYVMLIYTSSFTV